MNISNYRPILLLPLFSKVFEEDTYSRLMGHLNINKILVEEHFGFRKNLATEEAIYKLTNEILRALTLILLMWRIWWACNNASKWQMGFNLAFKGLNNMSMVGGIFCDLEKAFDSRSHEILSKVTYYGITGKAKLLFESCL